MYYRYELSIDGEPQGVGILMGISELDNLDDGMLNTLMKNFDTKLPLPSFYKENPTLKNKVTAYFTEKGFRVFRDDICRLIDVFQSQSAFDVDEIIIEENDTNVVYQDDFQVLILNVA